MSIQYGFSISMMEALKASMPTYASTTPAAPPIKAMSAASRRSCLTMRARPAPRAVRTATSLVRTVARARSKLATLKQAMSSTPNTATSMTHMTATMSGGMM